MNESVRWRLRSSPVPRGPHLCGLATLVLWLLAGGARAEENAPARRTPPRPTSPPSTADLDGIYLTIGPVGALTRIEGEWFTAVGAELSVVKIAERCVPAAGGVAFGGVSYAGRDGGRLWGEVEIAFNEPLPFALGVAAGVTVEVDPVRVPRWGFQGTIWAFAGIIPYVRVGTVEESGGFLELGVAIKLPRRLLR